MVWLRAAIAAIGVFLAAIGALAWLIDREGVEPRQLYRFDAPIVQVVLGARVDPDGSASETLETRVRHAVSGAGPGDVILVSGGVGTYGRSEAAVGCELAVQLGLERDHCLIEDQSHSTVENAKFSLELLRKTYPQGFHVLVVTDPYHVPRARRLFERLSGKETGTNPVMDAPRQLSWPQRIMWTMREVPALAKDLLLTR